MEPLSDDPVAILASMVGQRVVAIEQGFYVFQNATDPSECLLQMRFDIGRTVHFWAGGDGETVRIVAGPWDDPFKEPMSAENRVFVERSGKWTLFDRSTTTEMAPLIGQRIRRVFLVRDQRGKSRGVRLVIGRSLLTYAVDGDEGFVLHGPALDELARSGFILEPISSPS